MRRSAGILAWRRRGGTVELFLAHPGGPFWRSKDDGAWSIPKGEINPQEEPLAAAQREFREEIGQPIDGDFSALDPVKIASGKQIMAWAIEHDLDASAIESNHFEIEWPPRSGKTQSFPEVDRAAWFAGPDALQKITPGQVPLLVQLLERLGVPIPPVPARAGTTKRVRSGTAARRTAGTTRRR
ncbi:MAG TPA: NUDIX domain-containing protein [Reyranella sp.]|nr:NUDIX domain-containing protein [Reyranella sp.]